MPSTDSPDAAFGINIIGYITGNLGLGVATRNTVRMLTGRGVPMALTDVDPGGGRLGHDRTYAPLDPGHPDPTPHPLTIFHVNPPGLADQLWMQPSWTKADRISACVPFWELPVLPASWLPVLGAMDIILAPTHFIEQTVKAALPDALCLYYQQAAFLPDDVPSERERWGIPPDAVAFVSSFDISSDIERKNPEATIRAFVQAFPGRDDVCLVLKINSSREARDLFADRLAGLLEVASADPRIRLVDRTLAYRDVLSLYASSDVLVSLHRSEGLGLSLMEAMSLGRPVIATAWSGNMDFMTALNSCLVGYDLVPVNSEHPSYDASIVGEDVRWADPRVDEAAAFMRQLADDPAKLAAMGEQARRDMVELRSSYERGEIVDRLREAIEPGSPIWAGHPSKRARLKAIARGTLYRNVRRLGGRVLRKLGLRRPAR